MRIQRPDKQLTLSGNYPGWTTSAIVLEPLSEPHKSVEPSGPFLEVPPTCLAAASLRHFAGPIGRYPVVVIASSPSRYSTLGRMAYSKVLLSGHPRKPGTERLSSGPDSPGADRLIWRFHQR